MAQKTIFLSVGDESGDLHASNLMRAVLARGREVAFVGFGMGRMAAVGMETLGGRDEQGGAMWLHNVLRAGRFRRRLGMCREVFRDRRPDLVVLVDFGGFNFYVARAATAAGIPVLYYILPQVWAHGRYRLKKVRKWVTRSLVIYPFEPELYRAYGVDAEYVGHPLFDELARQPVTAEEVEHIRREVGGRIVALFPGSRRQEVRANLPVMLSACARVRESHPDVRFALISPSEVRGTIEGMLRDGGVQVALPQARPVALARAAELCLTKSGTITLEIASQLTPMIIFYRLSGFVYFLARGISHTPWVGIVNNLAGRMVCPEKAMPRPDVGWVTKHALEVLGSRERYEDYRRDLEKVMGDFARPGASERAAQVALEMVENARRD